jgi:hypothetical protein
MSSVDARTVIVDEIHAVIGSRRGAHLALSLERLGCREADALQWSLHHRLQVPHGRRHSQLHHRRCGAPAADRPRRRAAALDARRRDGSRGVGGVLRSTGRARPVPSDDARLREHASHGRASCAAPQRAARRRGGDGAPRQPVEGEAARRRNTAEDGTAAGARRDGLARARHRHRPRGPGLPDRIAAPHRHAAAAHRPFGPHDCGRPEGPRVPGLARRPRGVRGAPPLDPVRPARRHRLARRAARRAGAADRGGVRVPPLSGRRSLRPGEARLALP